MKRPHEIEGLVAQARYRSSTTVHQRIQRRLDDLWRCRRPIEGGVCTQYILGGGTTTTLSRVAFAVSVIVAVGILIGLLNKSGSPVYALDQTLDAVKDIRYFHFQYLKGSDQPNKEAWVEYDPNGSIRNVRVNYYDMNTVAVWSDGISQYWWRDRKDLGIYEDSEYTEKILFFVRRYDPRQAIAYLQERARQGGIQIDIDQPDGDADPVTVTVAYDPNTYLIGRPMSRVRELFRIDPATKWITHVEIERFQQDGYVRDGVWEYVDYNRPFDPNTFNLKAEAGADVNLSDTTDIAMGVEQGQLSDEEVSVKLVREFLDAWTAKDYDKAAQIHGYAAMGETKSLAKILGRKDILRVVSLGPAVRAEQPLRGLFVSGEVKCEENGQKSVMHLRTHVSQYSKGRWRIRDIGMDQ
jgi:hypothetical protein